MRFWSGSMGWVAGMDLAVNNASAIVLPQIQDETAAADSNSAPSQTRSSNVSYPLNLVVTMRQTDDSNVVDDQINYFYLPLVTR